MKELELKFAQYLFSYDMFVNPEPQMRLMSVNYVGVGSWCVVHTSAKGCGSCGTVPTGSGKRWRAPP